MDKSEVKQLLKRFYDGETTAEEEKNLKQYLSAGDCDPEFDADRKLFAAMEKLSATVPFPESLGERLEKTVDRLAEKERGEQDRKADLKFCAWVLLAAAASICLFIYVFYPYDEGTDVMPMAISNDATAVSSSDSEFDYFDYYLLMKRRKAKEAVVEPVAGKPHNSTAGRAIAKNKRKQLSPERTDEILQKAQSQISRANDMLIAETQQGDARKRALEILKKMDDKNREIARKIEKAQEAATIKIGKINQNS